MNVWVARGSSVGLVTLLLVLGALAAKGEPLSACDALHQKYADGVSEREATVSGRRHELRVYHDRSAPARAAAALLAVGLRHRLRYRSVALVPADRLLCQLAERLRLPPAVLDDYSLANETYFALIPSAVWGADEERCAALQASDDAGAFPPRLHVQARGAAPARTRLLAHLSRRADRSLCHKLARWSFYRNETTLETCLFLLDNETTSKNAARYVRMYYPAELASEAASLASRAARFGLRLRPHALGLDAEPRRALLALLREGNHSFLFLDYETWTGLERVYTVDPPPDETELDIQHTVRLADTWILRQVAPDILDAFHNFEPTLKDLREVLEIEADRSDANISEAACTVASKNLHFESWFNVTPIAYEVAAFLCEGDPDYEEHKKVLGITRRLVKTSFKVVIKCFKVDCGDEHSLMRAFIERAQSSHWTRFAGAMGAGAGAEAAVAAASALDAALVLYDVVVPLTPSPATRLVTGRLEHLTRALRHFVTKFGWTRLAVLSQDSHLASELFLNTRASSAFIAHDFAINPCPKSALENILNSKVRIIFVNSNSSVALSVLCEARDLQMTPEAGFVWILREWYVANATCKGQPLMWSLFTISFWWRGGNSTFPVNGTGVRDALDAARWASGAWPLRAAPLADALTVLLLGIENFVSTNQRGEYDLHGGNATRLFWENFDKHGIEGSTQTFKWDGHGIKDPYIYIDKWHGNRREVLAIWRVNSYGITETCTLKEMFDETPLDGSRFCLAKSDNESFSPYCYDDMCVSALCASALALPALALARRVRRGRLRRRRLALSARLLRLGGTLAELLVERAALRPLGVIGAGRFGVVRAAVLRAASRAIDVAAKALRDESTPAEEREFLNEAVILASLQHERVVRLVGVCVGGGPPLVLMERAFFRDLLGYLRARRGLAGGAGGEGGEGTHVSAAALTRLAREAAAALEYLATQGVVHRDVRAANCLVDSCRSLKLADFGLARRLTASGSYVCRQRGPLPVGWLAPESLSRGLFSAASDAWGLGVLLLELVTLGAPPYGAWPPQRVLGHVAAGGWPPLPPDASPGTRRALAGCWRRDASDRITAAALGAFLDANPELLSPALQPVVDIEVDDCRATLP